MRAGGDRDGPPPRAHGEFSSDIQGDMMKVLLCALMLTASAVSSAIDLQIPNILGVSCGGFHGTVTIVGFDSNNNVQGSLYETTTCSSGGRGSTPHTYTGSSIVTWDFRGGVITSYNAPLEIPASGGVAIDAYGNLAAPGNNPNIMSATLTVNQLPPVLTYVEAVVPNLIGLTDAEARLALTQADLVYGGATINKTYPAPAGTVFNQSPASGAFAPFGTAVGLWETPVFRRGGGGNN